MSTTKPKNFKYKLLKRKVKYSFDGANYFLYRIVALRNGKGFRKGEQGGLVSSLSCLSSTGNAWIDKDSVVINSHIDSFSSVFRSFLLGSRVQRSIVTDSTLKHSKLTRSRIYKSKFETLIAKDAVISRSTGLGVGGWFNVNYEFSFVNIQDCSFDQDVKLDKHLSKKEGNPVVIRNLNCKKRFHFLKGLIFYTFNMLPVKGRYVFYKTVIRTTKKNVYMSSHDQNFTYTIGKVSKVKEFNKNKHASCSSGIHVSYPGYWSNPGDLRNGNTLIAVEVELEDIIAFVSGKLRCKAVKVLGEVSLVKSEPGDRKHTFKGEKKVVKSVSLGIVQGYSYDKKTQNLDITFEAGYTYRFYGVTSTKAAGFKRSKNPTVYVNNKLVPEFKKRKLHSL